MLRLRHILLASGRELAILWYACRQPGTPFAVKLAALLLAVYALSPIDLVPDALPVLGWIDDITLLAFGIPLLLRWVPADALQAARGAADALVSRWKFWRAR